MFQNPETQRSSELRNLDWEVDALMNTRRSERVAWRVAAGFAGVALVMAAAITMLVPLHKVVPYVVTVDKLTGEAAVASTDTVAQPNTMSDKHWIKTFVVARERYNFQIVQQDYLTVRRLAGDGPWLSYAKLFDGEDGLDKQWGENVTVTPHVLSITLGGGNLATVRYELTQTDRRLVTPPVVSRRVATLRYSYGKRILREAEAIENPLGFVVAGYQTDPELIDAGAAK